MHRRGLVIILLLAAAVFVPTLWFEFVTWDDPFNITQNPYFLSQNFWGLWRASHVGMYIPVTYSLWYAIYSVFGANAAIFHGFNLVLHLSNIALVYAILSRYLKQDAVFLITTLFAIHPLQVESVAWVTGGRDLIALFFALLAVLSYLESKRFLAPILFAAAVLAKPGVVSVPLVLVTARCLEHGWTFQILRHEVRKLWLWWVVAAGIFVTTLQIQSGEIRTFELLSSMAAVAHAYGFYLVKFFAPVALSIDYGHTPDWCLQNKIELFADVAVMAAMISLSVWKVTKKNFRMGVWAYVLLLLPVSGVVPFAFQFYSTVADHYAYFPILAIAMPLSLQLLQQEKIVALTVSVLAVVSCVFLTENRLQNWKNSEALFVSTIKQNPESFSANNNLGLLYMNRGELQKAKSYLDKAFELKSDSITSLANRVVIMQKLGMNDEVLQFEDALREPNFREMDNRAPNSMAVIFNSLGLAHVAKKEFAKGFESICKALRLNPYNSEYRSNLETIRPSIKDANSRTCD